MGLTEQLRAAVLCVVTAAAGFLLLLRRLHLLHAAVNRRVTLVTAVLQCNRRVALVTTVLQCNHRVSLVTTVLH